MDFIEIECEDVDWINVLGMGTSG